MKKILNKFIRFWYFGVRNRVQKVVEVGGFKFTFRNYDVIVESMSRNFSLRVRATEFMFGYLASAQAQGKTDQLHGYAAMLYLIACNIAKDGKFSKDIIKATEKFTERQEALAAATAKKVSDGDNMEALEAVKDDAAVGVMSRRQRRKHKRDMAKVLGEAVKNQNKEKSND